MLLVLVVVLMFFGSTLAYIITAFAPLEGTEGQTQVPQNFIVEGKLNDNTRQAYLSQGYSIAEFHFNSKTPETIIYGMEDLPQQMQFQVIVQKFNDLEDGRTAWVSVESMRGYAESNITAKLTEILPAVCSVLFMPPMDCAFLNQTD